MFSIRSLCPHVGRLQGLATRFSVLSHVDASKNLPRMVDVSDKAATKRMARAESLIILPPAVFNLIDAEAEEIYGKKGPVFATAIVAGVMAAKRTAELVPFCHPVPLEDCTVSISIDPSRPHTLRVECTARTTNKTGVEMEALVGATHAALCIYDMLKAASKDITITDVRLLEKTGGKSDYSSAPGTNA